MADQQTDNAGAPIVLTPDGGGPPLWGLNDAFKSSNTSPLYFTDPWDTFWISGFQMPGECSLRGGGACHEYASKRGQGDAGSRLTISGYKPMPFEVAVEIVTTEQFAKLIELTELFWTRLVNRTPASELAVTVSHPDLHRLHIDRAVLVGLSLSERGSIEGTRLFVWKFHEYFPIYPKSQTKTAAGAVAEDKRKPAAASLASNAPPEPPESSPANMSTGGPPLQSLAGGP